MSQRERLQMKIDKKKALKKIRDANRPKRAKRTDINIQCDDCKHKWTLLDEHITSEMLYSPLYGTYEHRYFICPACFKQYTTYVGNSESEDLIYKRNEIKADIKKVHAKRLFDKKRYFELMAEDNIYAEKIKKISAALKQEMKSDAQTE